MQIRGVAYLSREGFALKEFGEARWRAFADKMKDTVPFLRSPVLPISLLPVPDFLRLTDGIVQTFYAGDPKTYWLFGEQSAAFALEHQLKGLFKVGQQRKVLEFAPSIWAFYYDGGVMRCESSGPNTIDLRVSGVPVRHIYFEYGVMGFAVGAVRALGTPNPSCECISSFAAGATESRYRFTVP